jgi:catechol 2,3-dioxygenase-like lactoylglutathione lyase family enzyme
VYLEQIAIIVDDYEHAIHFFVERLGFELLEDSRAVTNDGRPKRWVVVDPAARARRFFSRRQTATNKRRQFAGRVGLFLRVDYFPTAFERMRRSGVEFVTEPRIESYGQVAVFLDISGNRWDLLGPRPAPLNPPSAAQPTLT